MAQLKTPSNFFDYQSIPSPWMGQTAAATGAVPPGVHPTMQPQMGMTGAPVLGTPGTPNFATMQTAYAAPRTAQPGMTSGMMNDPYGGGAGGHTQAGTGMVTWGTLSTIPTASMGRLPMPAPRYAIGSGIGAMGYRTPAVSVKAGRVATPINMRR